MLLDCRASLFAAPRIYQDRALRRDRLGAGAHRKPGASVFGVAKRDGVSRGANVDSRRVADRSVAVFAFTPIIPR